MWCIQEITPEFRKRMYRILNLYQQPYNPDKPLLGLDEKPKQLLGEKRNQIPIQPGKTEKYDYEYTRNGTANIFMAVEPKRGKRITQVTDQRTKKDFAFFIKEIVDKKYPKVEQIKIILDNLNTHKTDSLYENFGEKEARRLLKKIKFYYTPTHASWLNVAEIEIGVMDTECTGRRIADKETLTREVKAWTKRRNRQKKKIHWTFTKQKADQKLSKYYTE